MTTEKCIPIIHQFIHNNKFYVYDTALNSLFEVTKDLYKELYTLRVNGITKFRCENKDSKLLFLINKGYFCHPKEVEICHPHYKLIDSLIDNRLSHMVLQITKECNFKCRYCNFAGDGTYNRKHSSVMMSKEIAQKAVDYLYCHSTNSDRVCICFYGGEPLLNFELVKYIVEYSRQKFFATELEFHMTTNASLLKDEVVEYLQNNNINLLISLDGPKEIQDRHRVYLHNGRGTYDVVINNIHNIINNHYDYFSRYVRFNPVMLSLDEKSTINSFFVNELGVPKGKITIRNANLNGIDYKNDYIKDSLEDKDLEDEFYQESMQTIKERKRVTSCWHHDGPCIPGHDRLFVTTEGDFYPCEKVPEIESVKIGNVENGIDGEKVKELVNIGHLTSEECTGCWAKNFCKICLAHCIDCRGNCVSSAAKLQECKKTRLRADLFLKKYVESEQE